MKNRRNLAATTTLATLVIAGSVSLGIVAVGNSTLAAPNNSVTSSQVNSNSSTPQIGSPKLESFVKTFGTVIPIVIGLVTYIGNERWKRRQYVEEKIKDFENKLETINVKKILSTELQCVELFPFESEPKHRYVLIKDCLWTEALLECKCNKELEAQYKSIDKEQPLYKQDAAIKAVTRDTFNRFLDHLQQFEKMIKSRVIGEKDLQNYLDSWFAFIKQVNDNEGVGCPISQEKYTPKAALLEYLGLLDCIPESELSIVQKDVRRLVERYCSLDSLMSEKKPTEPPGQNPPTNTLNLSQTPVSVSRC